MNTEIFSNAMSELDTKYVDEALNYKKKRKKVWWIKQGAAAACFCLIVVTLITIPSLLKLQESDIVGDDDKSSTSDVVAAPGFLMLTAYAASSDENLTTEMSSDEEVIMQEGIEVPVNYNWNLAMNSRPGIPLKLSAPQYSDIIFEISVDGGELLLWEGTKIIHLGFSYNAENNTTVYWTSMTQTEKGDVKLYKENEAYFNILIREEKNIVGYAVVEIHTNGLADDPSQTYYAKLLRSVSFPKVNGKYQKITAEYAASEIEQVKNEIQDE